MQQQKYQTFLYQKHNNHKYNLVTCEVFADPDQVEHARQTRFGLTLADTDISRFMWDNQFVLDNT